MIEANSIIERQLLVYLPVVLNIKLQVPIGGMEIRVARALGIQRELLGRRYVPELAAVARGAGQFQSEHAVYGSYLASPTMVVEFSGGLAAVNRNHIEPARALTSRRP
jgi:hypothetical protein